MHGSLLYFGGAWMRINRFVTYIVLCAIVLSANFAIFTCKVCAEGNLLEKTYEYLHKTGVKLKLGMDKNDIHKLFQDGKCTIKKDGYESWVYGTDESVYCVFFNNQLTLFALEIKENVVKDITALLGDPMDSKRTLETQDHMGYRIPPVSKMDYYFDNNQKHISVIQMESTTSVFVGNEDAFQWCENLTQKEEK